LLFSFSALFGRADSPEQAITGKVVDWIVLGPLWAGITYIGASAILNAHRKRFITAIGAAVVVWVTVALTANWWEEKKMAMRMRPFEQTTPAN
jgi:hypothetical protein